MRRFTEFVLAHKALVVVAWVLLFVGGGAASGPAAERLVVDFALPGQPGYETGVELRETYGNGDLDPYVLVYPGAGGGRVDEQAAAAAFAAVQQAVPTARVVSRATSGDARFTAPDGTAAFAYAFVPFPASFAVNPADPLKAAVAGTPVTVTGFGELALNEEGGEEGSVLVETLIGGLGALVVLAFVFASFLALVPLLIAAFSILTTFLIVLLLTTFTDVSFVVQFLIAFIGLGVAIDYSLIVVTRWREERDHGADPHDAVVRAMATAGSAVVFSGVTVAIGLLALIVVPVPLVRSMAFGGVLIPIVSTLVTLTLLPVLLATIGRRVDWPRLRHEDHASRGWERWARGVVRRRWLAAVLAGAALVVASVPVLDIKTGNASSASLAKAGPAYEALQDLRGGGVPAGLLTPMEVLTTPEHAAAVAERLDRVDGVFAAVDEGAVSVKDGKAVVLVIPEVETSSSDTTAVVEAVREAVADDPLVSGVAGTGPIQLDYVDAVYKNFPYVLLVIVLLTYVLLARAFRSLLLPLKAVLLNLVSLTATFGVMVWFWQQGNGSDEVFGIAPTGAITFWLPILLFAFLYGLSMDYEVFILARVREEYDAGGSTDAAVIEGIGRTGRLVTSAALILFLAFVSLASGPQVELKVLATALGFGILLDATIVRALLVPALVSLFGAWNWWLPVWAARLLRVEPSLPHAEPPRREVSV